jgi:hypothetical protein
MRLPRIVLFIAALLIPPALSAAQNRSTFLATAGPVTVAAESSSGAIVTLAHPDGRIVPLNKRLLFPVGDVRAFGNSRLILLSHAHHHRAAIVDIDSATVIDELSFGHAVVSPTGRFIAYDAFVPRWAESSALYLVYDVSKTPSANRMPRQRRRATVHKSYDHGWPVYPPANVAGRTYETTTYSIRPEADAWAAPAGGRKPLHHLASALTWIGDTTLALVDECDGSYTLVIADVAAGLTPPAVTTRALDADRGRLEVESLTRLPDRNGALVVQVTLRTVGLAGASTIEVLIPNVPAHRAQEY